MIESKTNYKCPICGQTALSKENEEKLIKECLEKLPAAALDGKKDLKLLEILNTGNYTIGKVTVYNKIFKNHKIVIRKPKKEKKVTDSIIRVTAEEESKIVEAYENGVSIKEMLVSKLLGDRTPSKPTIYHILQRRSPLYKNKNNTDEKQILIATLVNDHQSGLTTAEIASKNKISTSTVNNYLNESGVDISQGKEEHEKIEIYRFYTNHKGKDAKEIAGKKFGISETSVLKIANEIIEKFNLPKRDNSESHRIYNLNQDYFEVIDEEGKAYILLIIGTDGNVSGHSISIELKRSDKSILEHISKLIGSDKPIMDTIHFDKRTNKYSEGAKVTFISKKMTKDLEKYGIVSNKSLILNMNLDFVPKNLIRHCWRGGIDGDGWTINGGKIELGFCGTKEMMEKFKLFLLEELGIKETVVKHHAIWKLVIDSEIESMKVIKHLYSDASIFLERKNLLLLNQNHEG